MAFAVNSQRFDPYKNFKFRLILDGRHVFGDDSAYGGQIPQLAIANYRAGGDRGPSVFKPPGRSKYDAITLQRGVSYDPSFSSWAQQVYNSAKNTGAQVPGKNFRKDIYLEIFNEAGSLVMTYKFSDCWVSEYQALPNLSGKSNAIAIEHIKLENEGWMIVGLRHKSH
jgi:phage tail-like protein